MLRVCSCDFMYSNGDWIWFKKDNTFWKNNFPNHFFESLFFLNSFHWPNVI